MKPRSAKAKTLEWRLVPSFPDYEVSPVGDVRRAAASKTRRLGALLKPRADRYGYLTVCLCSEGKSMPRLVHRCVAEAYIGVQPTPQKFQVQHIDGDRQNNHFSNLKWGTPRENTVDMDRHGNRVVKYGEDNHHSKLTDAQVIEIREKYRPWKITQQMLADEYGVCFQLISLIVNRKIWTHI